MTLREKAFKALFEAISSEFTTWEINAHNVMTRLHKLGYEITKIEYKELNFDELSAILEEEFGFIRYKGYTTTVIKNTRITLTKDYKLHVTFLRDTRVEFVNGVPNTKYRELEERTKQELYKLLSILNIYPSIK